MSNPTISAEDVTIGQKIRYREMYDVETHEGIVVGITRYPGDPVGHISFELWDWDHTGLDDFSIWEVNEVEVL